MKGLDFDGLKHQLSRYDYTWIFQLGVVFLCAKINDPQRQKFEEKIQASTM